MSNPSGSSKAIAGASPVCERELMLAFTISEIHLGLALVSAARAAYTHGRTEFGDDARAKAQIVLCKAKALSNQLGIESKHAIDVHLETLQASLDGLLRPAT